MQILNAETGLYRTRFPVHNGHWVGQRIAELVWKHLQTSRRTQGWRCLYVLFVLVLLLGSVAGQDVSRLRNPYGLTEDEMDGLMVRSPALRDFAEFFSNLLLNTEMDRKAALAVYRPIRRLNMRQRDAFGSQTP